MSYILYGSPHYLNKLNYENIKNKKFKRVLTVNIKKY